MDRRAKADNELAFLSWTGSRSVPVPRHVRTLCATDGPGWQGVRLEVATARGWWVENAVVDGHLVALNLADEVLRVDVPHEGKWVNIGIPPGSFWINPSGMPFSMRVKSAAHWAGLLVDARFLDSVLGRRFSLKPVYGVADDLLRHLSLAMIHYSQPQTPKNGSERVARSLVQTFVEAVGQHHGEPVRERPAGGLARHQITALLEWLEDKIDQRISVEQMAERLHLSEAHFAREFKRSIGMTPWTYVLHRRLQRARQLLMHGDSASYVAMECGFADQAHLSRLLKRHFGLTPREIVRLGLEQAAES